jgi:nucleotide-binding universal stress UspA family protein
MLGLRRAPPAMALSPPRSSARPVMLATLDVPFDPAASSLAVDTAVESGQRLLVVNVSAVPVLPISMRLGYEYIETDDLREALRAPAELASSLGVPVELLRVSSPRPVGALLQVVGERLPGLLVVGPDRTRIGKRRLARIETRIRRDAPCLVWTCGEDALR